MMLDAFGESYPPWNLATSLVSSQALEFLADSLLGLQLEPPGDTGPATSRGFSRTSGPGSRASTRIAPTRSTSIGLTLFVIPRLLVGFTGNYPYYDYADGTAPSCPDTST